MIVDNRAAHQFVRCPAGVRPMASAPDVGRLRAAYHALFSDGVVPAGKLPELLTAAGLTTSSEQVEEARAPHGPRLLPFWMDANVRWPH